MFVMLASRELALDICLVSLEYMFMQPDVIQNMEPKYIRAIKLLEALQSSR